ncbi:MAG: ArsR family transcriptional regulator [Candidatus Hodarchaeales archaeon]|jgi:predicted transcriptional regulator
METRNLLISELANSIRVEILNSLHEFPTTFTDLSKKLNISNSEVSRHVTRLTEHGFVQKDISSRKFELTPLGKLITILFDPIDFVFHQAEFFRSHDVTDLPISFIRDLDLLDGCELIHGTGHVMLKLQEIHEDVKQEIWVMTDQPFPFGKPGLDVRYIVSPKMAKYKPEVKDINRSTKARVLPKISISSLILDQEVAMIFFPDRQGNPDYDSGFFAKKDNSTGLEYIKRIWNYFWEIGELVE